MTSSGTSMADTGSNAGTSKILLLLVGGALAAGAGMELFRPSLSLVGTWQVGESGALVGVRFDQYESFWMRAEGLQSFVVEGTYSILESAGNTYRMQITHSKGEGEAEIRLSTPDRMTWIDPEEPGSDTEYSRVGDWVMARHPSESSSSFAGAKPHLGCWYEESNESHRFDLSGDGSIETKEDGGAEVNKYYFDYSRVPFHFDITDSDGEASPEIVEFITGSVMRVSKANLPDGARPETLGRFQT